jgi:hypothetical protein
VYLLPVFVFGGVFGGTARTMLALTRLARPTNDLVVADVFFWLFTIDDSPRIVLLVNLGLAVKRGTARIKTRRDREGRKENRGKRKSE